MNTLDLAVRADAFHRELKRLRRDVRKLDTKTVSRKDLRATAESLAKDWFDLSQALREVGVANGDILGKYDDLLRRLLKISAPSNRKSSYLEVLDEACARIRDEVVLPLHAAPNGSAANSEWSRFLDGLPGGPESEYLREALECARSGYLRAATVLGWCACVDHLHRKVAQIGFSKFNLTSAAIANQDGGRFKRFNKIFKVSSISELRSTVFDTDLLWVLEGMGLIDANQHQRLRSCFEMRNQAAHPGDAPITVYNLMSFFSDIIKIVLRNPSLALEVAGTASI